MRRMRKEISPKAAIVIIAVAVVIVAAVVYQLVFKPAQAPTVKPRPWSPSYGGGPAGAPPSQR
ncbi:MAG: hypothetical protein LDL56_02445 [Armatimonadetes bacterium]|nr:hypothetical protein [Armatimonadota bacterium]